MGLLPNIDSFGYQNFRKVTAVFIFLAVSTVAVESRITNKNAEDCKNIHCQPPPSFYVCELCNDSNPKIDKALGPLKDCCDLWCCHDQNNHKILFVGVSDTKQKRVDSKWMSFSQRDTRKAVDHVQGVHEENECEEIYCPMHIPPTMSCHIDEEGLDDSIQKLHVNYTKCCPPMVCSTRGKSKIKNLRHMTGFFPVDKKNKGVADGKKKCSKISCSTRPDLLDTGVLKDGDCKEIHIPVESLKTQDLTHLNDLHECCPSVWKCTSTIGQTFIIYGVSGQTFSYRSTSLIEPQLVANKNLESEGLCAHVTCPKVPTDSCEVIDQPSDQILKFARDQIHCCPTYNCSDRNGWNRIGFSIQEGKLPMGVNHTLNCDEFVCGPKPKIEEASCILSQRRTSVGSTIGILKDCCTIWECDYTDSLIYHYFQISGKDFTFKEIQTSLHDANHTIVYVMDSKPAHTKNLNEPLSASSNAEQTEQVDVDNLATEKMKTQEKEFEGTKEIASNTGYIDENVENDATHVKFMHTPESTDHDHILSSQLSKRNEAMDGNILNMPTSTEETATQQIEKFPNNVEFDANRPPSTGSRDINISYVTLKGSNDQVTENDNSMTTTSSASQESPRHSQQIVSFLMPAQRSSGGNPAEEQISEKQVIYFVTENPTFLNDQAQPMVESESTQKTITYLFADNNSKDLKPSDYEIIKASNRDFIAQNQNFHNPNVNSMDNRLQEWMFPNFAKDQAMHTGLHDMFHQTQMNKGSEDADLPLSIQITTTAKSVESSNANPETFPSSANKPLVDPRVSSISGDANTGNNIFLPELSINSQVNWGDEMQKGSEGLAGLVDKSTNEEANEIDVYEDNETIHDKVDQETLQRYDDKGVCIPEKMCPNIKFKGACSLENTTQADKFRPKTKNCCPLTHCVDVHKSVHRTYYIIQAGTIPTEKSEIKRQKGKRTQTTTCSNIKCMNQTEIPNAKSCLKSMNVSPRVAKMLPFLECCGMLKCERKRDSYSVEMKILGTTFYYYETSFYNISEWKDLGSRNNSKILGSARKNSSNPSGPNTLFDFSFPNTHSGQQITPNIGGKLEITSQPKKKSKVSKPKSTAKPKNNQRKSDDSIEEDSEEEMWKMHKDLHGINDKHHGISKKKPSKAKKDEKRNGQNIAGSKSSKNKNRPLSPPPFENGFAESRSQQDSGLYNDVASMFNGVFG